MSSRNLPVLILAGLVFLFCISPACFAQAGGNDAPSPFTCLFDTSAPSAAVLSAEVLTARKGWAAVPADTLVHTFGGDAVIANDSVTVVLRRDGIAAEVYSNTWGNSKQRATLVPLGMDGLGGTLSSLKIIENSQASVMLEAGFTAKSGTIATFRFRLTAGESLLDVRGGQDAGRIRICDQAQYVVVPDFFADDMVFDAKSQGGERIGLPAENSVLGLTDAGNAIVACVWPSSRQSVDLLLVGEGDRRKLAGYEIDLPANGRLWIAAMEGASIWHAELTKNQKAGADLTLNWKPPIPARWRADFTAADGMALSTYFADPDAAAEPENARSNGSCRFDAGRALVRSTDLAGAAAGVVVVYPVERTRTTPLTAFCLVDIMRNALGVGPCQYVLDAEGLGNSESPTPDQVTHWVEKQFEKKVSKRDVDTIREQLVNMSVQVKRTDARIAEYIDFAAKINQACTDYANDPAHAPAANHLAAIANQMTPPATVAFPVVEKLAGEVSAQADRDDALAKSQASLVAIRTAGAVQDHAMAKLRMAARRLKQEARTLAVNDPKAAGFAALIQQQAGQILIRK